MSKTGAGSEKALGQMVQKARKKAGLTQQDLCHKAGLSYSTLAKIERGAIKAPSIFTIQNIAGVLGTSMDALVGLKTSGAGLEPKKRAKTGVTFVYFDINGCLVRFFHRAFVRLAEDSGKSSDIVESAFWNYNDAACRGEMSLADFNKNMAKKLGLPKVDWQKYYLEAVEPIKDMQELLVWVANNYDTGILSNIMPGLVDALVNKGFIPSVNYKAIVDSSAVKAIKPEAKIYEIAQKKAARPAEEILLVDDSRPNLMAAGKRGWHTLWFDDYKTDESIKRIRKALEF